MSDEERKNREAIEAVLVLAEQNWPRNTMIEIAVRGPNSASISLSPSQLRRLLAPPA